MKREIYVFMDSVSRNFGEPFTMANDAELRRHFVQMVRNPDIPVYAIRDTLVLHLGTFVPDSDNPIINAENIPTVVLRGDSFDIEKIREGNFVSTSELHTSENC